MEHFSVIGFKENNFKKCDTVRYFWHPLYTFNIRYFASGTQCIRIKGMKAFSLFLSLNIRIIVHYFWQFLCTHFFGSPSDKNNEFCKKKQLLSKSNAVCKIWKLSSELREENTNADITNYIHLVANVRILTLNEEHVILVDYKKFFK